jgi:hypothetical protein
MKGDVMFSNVILPDVPIDQMRGLFSLLTLIANPESKAASDLLTKLSAEKDAAVATLAAIAVERAEIERRSAALATLEAREAAVVARETQLATAQADVDRRTTSLNERLKAIAAAAQGFSAKV